MKFCCKKFNGHWSLNKQSAPNIRIVKYTSAWLNDDIELGGVVIKKKSKLKSPYRFYITWGYEKDFSFDLITLFIEYCPFCGTDLFKFYNDDSYVQEVEGETFKII